MPRPGTPARRTLRAEPPVRQSRPAPARLVRAAARGAAAPRPTGRQRRRAARGRQREDADHRPPGGVARGDGRAARRAEPGLRPHPPGRRRRRGARCRPRACGTGGGWRRAVHAGPGAARHGGPGGRGPPPGRAVGRDGHGGDGASARRRFPAPRPAPGRRPAVAGGAGPGRSADIARRPPAGAGGCGPPRRRADRRDAGCRPGARARRPAGGRAGVSFHAGAAAGAARGDAAGGGGAAGRAAAGGGRHRAAAALLPRAARAGIRRGRHPYTARDVARIERLAAARRVEYVVTTEKDRVRLLPYAPFAFPLLSIPLAVPIEPEAAFRAWLGGRVERARAA